jgi:HEAT repeat protein
MTPSTLPNPADAPDAPAAPESLRLEVLEVVRGFGKALKVHLLYEGAGPALERFVETLRSRMGALWERMDHLTVGIEEHDVVWEGVSVWTAEERGEDLPFLLYKDGVRELSFYPGFEKDELVHLVNLLAHIHRLRRDEDDLLTLLWEHDWLHLRYRYVEPLSEGVVPPVPSGEAPKPVDPRRYEEPEPEPPSVVSSVSREDFQEALYFLDEVELRRLEDELRLEERRDLWRDVLNALFDRLQDGDGPRQEHICTILSDILPTLLGAGRLDVAAYLLGELVAVATSGAQFPPGVLRTIRGLFDQLARPETVAELVRIVEEGGPGVSEGALAQLFGFFPPEALGPLLHAGETSSSPALRASIMTAAARLLGRLRVQTAAGEVARLLTRPEVAVRLTAVEALAEIRSPNGAGALETALEDADREVRVAAARALAAIRYAPARAKLEAALDGKRLREADLTERIAFFEAYGAIAGEGGVGLLDRMLNGKNWLGRRETGEMRACAALGLGRIRHPAAERALAGAAADADPVVRSAVGRALRTLKQ